MIWREIRNVGAKCKLSMIDFHQLPKPGQTSVFRGTSSKGTHLSFFLVLQAVLQSHQLRHCSSGLQSSNVSGLDRYCPIQEITRRVKKEETLPNTRDHTKSKTRTDNLLSDKIHVSINLSVQPALQ